MKVKKITVFLVFLVFSFFLPNLAFGEGIQISPVKIDKVVKPGEILNLSLRVKNISNGERSFYFYVSDFEAADESGAANLVPPGSMDNYSLANWVQITQNEITLKPQEEKVVPFKIFVPKNASPGGHYGAIVVATLPPALKRKQIEKGAAIAIAQQTGCLVLLNVTGEVVQKALVVEFRSDKNLYSTPFQVKFITRIKNLGNIYIKPRGFIKITNMVGTEVANLKVNEENLGVLPQTIRRFENEWNGKFGFGKYKASLALTYGIPPSKGGKGRSTLYGETSFWIFPSKVLLYGFISLILASILFIFGIKTYKNKAIERALREAALKPKVNKRTIEVPNVQRQVIVLIVVLSLILAGLFGLLVFFLVFG